MKIEISVVIVADVVFIAGRLVKWAEVPFRLNGISAGGLR